MMRLAILAVALLAVGCSREPAKKQEPAQSPIAAILPKPAAVKPPPVAAPKAAVRSPKIAKGKTATPKAKRTTAAPRKAAVPSWCVRIPSWVTLSQIESEATKRGHAMTPKQKRQAEACLASKR